MTGRRRRFAADNCIAVGIALLAAPCAGITSASANDPLSLSTAHEALQSADPAKPEETKEKAPAPVTNRTGLWVRGAIGPGIVANSATESALRVEGYWSPFHLFVLADAGWFFSEAFGAGVWGAAALRVAPSSAGGPTYRDLETLVGAALSARYLIPRRNMARRIALQATARAGYAAGWSGFYSFGTPRNAFAYGIEAGVELPIVNRLALGVALGYVTAPTPTTRDFEDTNLGSFYLCFTASHE